LRSSAGRSARNQSTSSRVATNPKAASTTPKAIQAAKIGQAVNAAKAGRISKAGAAAKIAQASKSGQNQNGKNGPNKNQNASKNQRGRRGHGGFGGGYFGGDSGGSGDDGAYVSDSGDDDQPWIMQAPSYVYEAPQSDDAASPVSLDDDAPVDYLGLFNSQPTSRGTANLPDGARRGSRGQILPNGTPRTGSSNSSQFARSGR
jgi:hypothetical protein